MIPLLIWGFLLGGFINIPIWSRPLPEEDLVTTILPPPLGVRGSLKVWAPSPKQRVYLNLGGCILPVLLSIVLIARDFQSSHLPILLLNIAIVATVAWFTSYIVPERGVLIAPLPSALAAAILTQSYAPDLASSLAFPSAVLGVLIGGDIVRLPAMVESGLQDISVGGAGSLDAVLLVGLIAVALS